jgi:hypothetical protein
LEWYIINRTVSRFVADIQPVASRINLWHKDFDLAVRTICWIHIPVGDFATLFLSAILAYKVNLAFLAAEERAIDCYLGTWIRVRR